MVIPQGSTLIGKVSCQCAKSFGRTGSSASLPAIRSLGNNRRVEGALAGAATEKTQDLSLDAEGTITPHNKSSVIAPLLLTMLAGRALDEDGNLTVQTGVASNGFGLVGRILGIAAGDRNLAAVWILCRRLIRLRQLHPTRSRRDFPQRHAYEIETTPLEHRSSAARPMTAAARPRQRIGYQTVVHSDRGILRRKHVTRGSSRRTPGCHHASINTRLPLISASLLASSASSY